MCDRIKAILFDVQTNGLSGSVVLAAEQRFAQYVDDVVRKTEFAEKMHCEFKIIESRF